MKRGIFLAFLVFLLASLSFSLAEDYYQNAEVDAIISLPATGDWVAVEVNTTEFDFGYVDVTNSSLNLETAARTKYKIRNRGNVNVTVT